MPFLSEIHAEQNMPRTYFLNETAKNNDRIILSLHSDPRGFVENSFINAHGNVLFFEPRPNSSKVQIEFQEAYMSLREGASGENKISDLNYSQPVEAGVSNYPINLDFTYQRANPSYKIKLTITNNDESYMKKEFGATNTTKSFTFNLLEIKSSDYYSSQYHTNLVTGFTIIGVCVTVIGFVIKFLKDELNSINKIKQSMPPPNDMYH